MKMDAGTNSLTKEEQQAAALAKTAKALKMDPSHLLFLIRMSIALYGLSR
jgi:hypothetical protein